jgi:hypothetical protein
MSRFVKPTLALVLLLTGGVIAAALRTGGSDVWATVAGGLAVIAAVVSAWTAQDVVELERARLQPDPYPFFDAYRRYSLLQLRVTNLGGSVARNIRIRWHTPLISAQTGAPIRFSGDPLGPDIPVLLPGASVAVLVGESHTFFSNTAPPAEYSGVIEYENAAGKLFQHPFVASAEALRHSLTFDDESPKTQHELQRIPKQLKEIAHAIASLRPKG